MKQVEVSRIKVLRRVTSAGEVLRVAPQIEVSEDVPRVDLRAQLSAHSVEEFDMDDGGSESHAAEDDISEEAEEEIFLVHSQYWSWCPHCVDGHGVGQGHVPFEVESGALPMIVMD